MISVLLQPSSPIPRVSLRVIDLNEKTIIKELRPPLSLRDQWVLFILMLFLKWYRRFLVKQSSLKLFKIFLIFYGFNILIFSENITWLPFNGLTIKG